MSLEKRFAVPGTFGLASVARMGCRARSVDDVRHALDFANHEQLNFVPLGQGSNVLPRPHIDSLICVMANLGKDVMQEDESLVHVRVAAGENWHDFVMHCLQQGWFGLENLALIPGSVGAAPVQNIGAYGVEVAEYITQVHVVYPNGENEALQRRACEFSYRDSRFKRTPGAIIVAVDFALRKAPEVITDYPDLSDELHRQGNGQNPDSR